MSKKIGIMGGTFDPIHYGHLVLAEEVLNAFSLDKIYFIPVGKAPHKNEEKADKDMRFQMVQLATITNPNFRALRIEIDSEDVSYTVNTLKKLKSGENKDDELYFITGADAIMHLESWMNFEELFKICNFIAATRPGIDYQSVINKIEYFKMKYCAKIFPIEVPALDISSTEIRDRVKGNRSIKYLVPESVEAFIKKNNLYKKG